MIPADVPSPIDLTDMKDAREWERTAMLRPFREDFFAAITAGISARQRQRLQVLKFGSGPGFLAEYALSRLFMSCVISVMHLTCSIKYTNSLLVKGYCYSVITTTARMA